MKFGICGDPDLARIAKTAGYDYFEWSVGSLLHPREDEQVFEKALEHARATGLPFPRANIFIPADLKITGPEVNRSALEAFISTTLRRAEKAGVKIIGLGSGSARSFPQGFNPRQAWEQMVHFCRWMAPIAEQHGVTIAIEPLNRSESNLINTLEEAARLAREVDQPSIRLLADGYHWAKDQNAAEGILENADLIVHAHIATVGGRRPPSPGDDCAPFMRALNQAGYQGWLSFEGNISDPAREFPIALDVMRRLSKRQD